MAQSFAQAASTAQGGFCAVAPIFAQSVATAIAAVGSVSIYWGTPSALYAQPSQSQSHCLCSPLMHSKFMLTLPPSPGCAAFNVISSL